MRELFIITVSKQVSTSSPQHIPSSVATDFSQHITTGFGGPFVRPLVRPEGYGSSPENKLPSRLQPRVSSFSTSLTDWLEIVGRLSGSTDLKSGRLRLI